MPHNDDKDYMSAEHMRTMKNKGYSESQAVTKLVSMKNNKKDKKSNGVQMSGYSEDYPYGLTVDLDDDSLTKLGMDKLPAVGKTVKVLASAEVKHVSESADKQGKNRNLSLQITKMKLG